MTTPATLNSLLARIRQRFEEARSHLAVQKKAAASFYMEGYYQGYYDALGETLEEVTGESVHAKT